MKKQTFYSIRVVYATTPQEAQNEAQNGNFDDYHELSDLVLTADELMTELKNQTNQADENDFIQH